MNDPVPIDIAVLHVQVNKLGIVRKTPLETNGSNAALDRAAQCTLVGAKLIPYREAGEAVAVTTLRLVNARASADAKEPSCSTIESG